MKQSVIESRWVIGDWVYHQTVSDNTCGMVVGINVTPNGIKYVVSWERYEDTHYELELSDTPCYSHANSNLEN